MTGKEWSMTRVKLKAAVPVAVGVLLLTTGCLKLLGMHDSAPPLVGLFSTPWFEMAAVEWELVLGLWLLSGKVRAGSWGMALLTFLTFASVSGYLGWIGQASCGCFGALKASPWIAFGVDLIVLALLVVARPNWHETSHGPPAVWRRIFVRGLLLVMGAAAILGLVTGAAALAYGSVEGALARLRGDSVAIYPAPLDFGSGEQGQVLDSVLEVRNWTDRPIRVIGGKGDCSFVVTESLPVTVPAGDIRTIKVKMKVPQSQSGMFTKGAELWTDFDEKRTIRLTAVCRVRVSR
jgi:hypothetical protein